MLGVIFSLSYQVSDIGQVLISENGLSVKLSYVQKTVQNRPCCLVTNHRFFFIHAAHSSTL